MKIPQNKIKSLRHILYLKSKESNAICVTLTGFKRGDNSGTIIIEKADIKNLVNLNKHLAIDNFWRARIDVFDRNISDNNPIKTYEYTDETTVVSELGKTSETDMDTRLNEMLDIRLQKIDLQRLQNENLKMQNHIEELENELEEAEELIEQMQEKIKSQQSIKSYVGLAGVALDALGLKKGVAGALSGFFGDDDETDEKSSKIEDNSCIIESPEPIINPLPKSEPKQEPQNDFVELSKSCMERMDKRTMGVVFSIFSEIEKNKELALPVLAMINEYNTQQSSDDGNGDETDDDDSEFSNFKN